MKRIISLVFLSIVFVFSLMTLYTSRESIKYIVKNTSAANNNVQDFSSNINKVLKNYFWHKNVIINFYGLSERLLGKRASNDRRYYRDSSNIMHIDRGVHDFGSFYKDVNWLSEYCKEKRIPLVINQVPEKGIFGDTYSKLVDSECTTNYIGRLKEIAISNNNIYVNAFDLPGNNNLLDTDIFFKTDFHCTTLAELTELSEIVNQLQFCGVKFYKPEIVLDFDNSENYENFTRKFIGNLSSQYGKFYAGTDSFVYYVPKYETDMQRINKWGVVYKSGKFTDSMLNGLSVDSKNWKYYVTDYLNWPEPYLEIYNNLAENAPNILVFIDSQSMRTVTYLSLMCSNVTVLDPRYFNENNNYFDKIKDKAYDAVIVFATCDLYRGLTYESELPNKTTGGGISLYAIFSLLAFTTLVYLAKKRRFVR